MTGPFGSRAVRFDAYLDDGDTIYDIEMQTSRESDLPKRSRLYQSHIDVSQLNRGEYYGELRPCYVIFICKYDPFGEGLYRYSFRNRCDEGTGRTLDDGAYKLFFNTAGYKGDISPELKELLRYMNNTSEYPVSESCDSFIRKIDEAVTEAKMSREWRDAFMNYRINEMDAEHRGQIRGQAIGEAIGQARGEAIGEAKGARNKAIETAKKMLEMSFSIDDIVQISGLSVSEVEALNTSNPNS